jgi:hypothetical protein
MADGTLGGVSPDIVARATQAAGGLTPLANTLVNRFNLIARKVSPVFRDDVAAMGHRAAAALLSGTASSASPIDSIHR